MKNPARVLALLPAVLVAGASFAIVPDEVPELPILAKGGFVGGGHVVDVGNLAPTPKTVDGDIADWTGTATGYGGTTIYSRGEFIYQDHIFDAYGADTGQDVSRAQTLDSLEALEPRVNRLEALYQQDPAGQVGFDSPDQLRGEENYGDAGFQEAADLVEVRVAADTDTVWILARTTTMTASGDRPALLLLADTVPGGTNRTVPFNSKLATEQAEVAILLAEDGGWVADLASGLITPLPIGSVKTAPGGTADPYVNAIEAAIPRPLLEGGPAGLRLAIAAGLSDGAGSLRDLAVAPNLANVAFRTHEPIRTWFEREQAFALHAGSIDPFLADIDLAGLTSGRNEVYVPGTGYHDRIFVSGNLPSGNNALREGGRDGMFQHYGVFLPSSYVAGTRSPLQFWLHWRGGKAHSAAQVLPHMFRDLGEEVGTIVVSPSARGTSTWYVSRGHVDFLEVWNDVHSTFSIDEDRTYVTGHSMGGFGSYLLTVLYPDRFAAGMPVSPPVTQGAWTGLDFPGCDEYRYDEYSFCYVETNGSRARDQHTRKLLDNLRHTPLMIYAGGIDELVPVSGEARQAERLVELGYTHRLYVFPTYEHFTPPIVDEWAEGARYMHSFVRNPDPARVTYVRNMPFERATEEVQSNSTVFHFDFDSAYWMSELTATDATNGVAAFDGSSLAIAETPEVALPEVGGPTALGQSGPFVMVGLRNTPNPLATAPTAINAFQATVNGATAVRLDLKRMKIDRAQPIHGAVANDTPLALRLDGGWTAPPAVITGGTLVDLTNGVLTIAVPAGSNDLVIQ